jgi:hypothetical protein
VSIARNSLPNLAASPCLVCSFCEAPGGAHHGLKIVISIDACGNVGVVVGKLGRSDLVVAGLDVPLGHELGEDFILGHLTARELGVERDIVDASQVSEVDNSGAILIELREGHLDKGASCGVHFTADTTEELIEGDTAVVVLVEVLEDSLELAGAEFVSIFAEAPLELIAVELLVAVVVHTSEDESESTDTMGTTGFKGVTDFGENLEWGLTVASEGGVHVGVVSGSTDSEHSREFFIIEATVAVLILTLEDSVELEVLEGASKSFEGLSELSGLNCAKAIIVKVFEDLFNSSSFIFGSMGALAHLLEDTVLELGKTGWGHSAHIGIEAPGLDNHVYEVVFTLVRHNSVDFSVILNEGIARDLSIAGLCAKKSTEVVENGFGLLLAGSHTGVCGGVVLGDEALERAGIGTSCDLVPGVLDDLESLCAHISLQNTAVVSLIFSNTLSI